MRHALRHPAPAIVIVLTIGLAVGVVSTIFTAFDAVLLRDLPVRDADRLVRVAAITPRGTVNDAMAWSDFDALRHVSGPITVAAYTAIQELVRDPATERIASAGVHRVSDRFFDVAGVRFIRGTAGDAVVSERFASLREVVVDGVTYPVAGVVAFRGMNFASPSDVFLGLDEVWRRRLGGESPAGAPAPHSVRVIGRLAPGASFADAEKALARLLPDPRVTAGVRVGPERAMLINPEAPGMVRAASGVAGLLALAAVLVAAANVIGVLFARVAVRRRELAVRMALGATPARVARQIVLETLPLAIPAALLAYGVAVFGSRVYTAFMPPTIAPMIDFTPGARVALFALGMSLVATLFAALAASVHAKGAGASELAARGVAARVPLSLRALVVAQLAFTVVVLIVAALLVQTARAYGAVDPGFEYDRQLNVDLRDGMPRIRELADRLRQMPGVTHVAIATNTPLGRQTQASLIVDGETRDGRVSRIEGDFFGAIGIPVLRGRALNRGDVGVAVVNEAARVGIGRRVTVDGRTVSVVGVVRDARMSALAERPRPHVWLPWNGEPARLQVRCLECGGIVAAIQSGSVAAALQTATVTPLKEVVDSDRWLARTASAVAGALGALTLLLAAIGLFGVVSTTVTTRLREIAVRMALGATRGDVGRLVAGASGRFLLLGVVCGAALAIPAARLLGGLLFGVHAFDAASWATPAIVITAVVALATLLPMLRAMRTEPERLLREI